MHNWLSNWVQKIPGIRRIPRRGWGIGLLLLLSLAVWAANAYPATPQETPGASLGTLLDVYLKLGVVIVLIYGGLYALRRWQGSPKNRTGHQVAVLETARLSPRQSLYLVRAGSQVLLVGATDQALTALAEIELPSRDGQPGSFAGVLDKMTIPGEVNSSEPPDLADAWSEI